MTETAPTRRIQIMIDEDIYEQFQLLRHQANEPSDSALGRKIITDYVTNQVNGAGTQRHFHTTFQDHLNRNDWISLLNLYMLTSMFAAVTASTDQPQSARDIFQDIATSFTKGYERLNTEITHLMDVTEDN